VESALNRASWVPKGLTAKRERKAAIQGAIKLHITIPLRSPNAVAGVNTGRTQAWGQAPELAADNCLIADDVDIRASSCNAPG
jgi:hypothetical protein